MTKPFKQCQVCGAKRGLYKEYDGAAGAMWLCKDANACINRREKQIMARLAQYQEPEPPGSSGTSSRTARARRSSSSEIRQGDSIEAHQAVQLYPAATLSQVLPGGHRLSRGYQARRPGEEGAVLQPARGVQAQAICPA